MRQIEGDRVLEDLGLEHLKNAAALGALSDQAIAYLMAKGKIHRLRKGETLIESGSPSGSFFIVLNGSLGYHQTVENGHLEHIYDFHFGEAIGFVSMIALTPWPGTTLANDDSLVLEVTSDLFYQLHCEMPLDFGVLLINLSRELARKILELIQMVGELKRNRQ
ncbi:Crp/Fnr family transcriptional regulator [Microbulbifer pacificus]|uniref:Crp/Fnr family transcriptional regulator n=1 Tax=Microbulbifer pacificus TaxID=407164 RepID=UPI000CF50B5A|nr:cyclic nucleotide-binding domain-containing protein [Microbulbifer pacificus]